MKNRYQDSMRVSSLISTYTSSPLTLATAIFGNLKHVAAKAKVACKCCQREISRPSTELTSTLIIPMLRRLGVRRICLLGLRPMNKFVSVAAFSENLYGWKDQSIMCDLSFVCSPGSKMPAQESTSTLISRKPLLSTSILQLLRWRG